MKLALIALIVILAIAVVAWLVLSGQEPPAPQATKPKPAPRPAPQPPHEGDEEVTILSFKPIMLDDLATDEWTDSGVELDADLGSVRPVLHDPGAADDEPSAVTPLLLVSAVGNTHRGRRRKNNEDSFLVLESQHLFVVADGMGGYAGGEVASRLAVETIERAFVENRFVGGAQDTAKDGAQLAAAVQMANRSIWDEAVANPALAGMGTTVCAARFAPRKERVYIAHVGDSRCYRFRDNKLEQITRDHTLREEGVTGPMGHQLTRAVGIGPSVEVDLVLVEPMLGDHYLLCSDGLTKMVPEEEIGEIMRSCSRASVAVEALVNRANQLGGKDNITVIVVTVKSPSDFEDESNAADTTIPADVTPSPDELPTVEDAPNPVVSEVFEEPTEDPAPADEPTEEPAAEEAPADEPTEEPAAEEPAAEEAPAEEPAAEEAPAEEPAAEEPAAEPKSFPVLDGSVADLKAALETGTLDGDLDGLLEAEKAGKNRKTAIAAIEDRKG
ncbi:MAG: serine/threonine-protein phosphatase [Deltaproteobacteria bacterium]|nr:MAG: serine/threonine-protein phosphatase [Deltaproteobacteria bacterium]